MGAVFGKFCSTNEMQIMEQSSSFDLSQFNKQVQAYKTAVVGLAERINEEREAIFQGEALHSTEVMSMKVRFVSLYDQLRSEADILEETARKSEMPVVSQELQDIVERNQNQAVRIQHLCKESKLLLLEIERARKVDEGVSQEEIASLE
ncbi:MAG: hypothetical protein ACI9S8_002693 [Chlamydiales bacterium]|jgi:hypothetical protein